MVRGEADAPTFFRCLSEGYGPRMNAVLAGFMHARLAGVLEGAETMDYLRRRDSEGLNGPKPGWGDTQKPMDEIDPDMAEWMSDDPGVPMGEEKAGKRADTMAWLRVRE